MLAPVKLCEKYKRSIVYNYWKCMM